jgi:hypothetical protein
MKQKSYVFAALALACVVPLFLGCPGDESPNLGGEKKDLPAVSLATADGVKYYSLSTGAEVTGDAIKTSQWDIAFSRTRLIFTNSGATASDLGSGGKGGVWYTGKTVLGDVADTDKTGEDDAVLKDYLADKKVWVSGMGGATQTTLNVMTYVGYETGDGSSAENPLAGYAYNQKQYYGSGGMGVYSSAGKEQVYIIRHGDGTHYSKIIIDYEYDATGKTDNWAVSYQNF